MYQLLSPTFLHLPNSDWNLLTAEFEDKWNFPHFLGAIDGKHVILKCPNNAGSHLQLQKIKLYCLACCCWPDYEIMYADVGANE